MADRSGYIGRAPSDSSVTIARQTFRPTGIQTSFIFTSAYTPNHLDVYINGSRLIDISDYSATDGNTISLIVPATSGDIIECVAYKAFNVATSYIDNTPFDFTVGQNLTVGGYISAGGSITGTEFYGDGSNLEGVASAGLGTALSDIAPLDVIYYTNNILSIGATITIDPPATTNVAYTQYADIAIEQDCDLIIEDGDDFIPDILGLSTAGATPLLGSGGRVRADNFTNKAGNGAPNFPSGLTGTTGTFSGAVSGTTGTFSTGTFSGNVSVGGTLTYEDVTNVDSIGIVTARLGIRVGAGQSIGSDGAAIVYYGDGSNLDGVVSGIELKQAGSSVGTSLTAINFASGATLTTGSAGVSTITIAAGISTTALTPSANTVVTLDLSAAQHHDLTLTAGITTITCSGGSFGESHSVVISQPSSGIATVGFSTFFLFPSGATPSMSEGSSKVDLVSFVVKRVGAGGTQLLASAGLNYN